MLCCPDKQPSYSLEAKDDKGFQLFGSVHCNFELTRQRLWEPIDRQLICCGTIPSFHFQLIWSLSKWTAIDREQVATLCRDGIGPSRRELATDNSLQNSLSPCLSISETFD